MEKQVNLGVSKLPPGFRFEPTDEELVFQYLKCKVFSYPLPASIIPEINVCKYDPWDLPGNCDPQQERHFFSQKEAKYRNGNRMNRKTKCGYWKATGSDKRIISSTCINNAGIMGIRKTFIFYEGSSAAKGSRTHWVLHEYRLLNAAATNNEIGDWVLCRLSIKKKSTSTVEISDGSATHHNKHSQIETRPATTTTLMFDFMMVGKTTNSSTSSSCSSSSNASDHQETTSTAYAHF